MDGPVKHISVCICTYKRPAMLLELLGALEGQVTEGLFSYSIVVTDNDRDRSAPEIAGKFRSGAKIRVDYYLEPVQNIAMARNRAVQNAHGDFLAFIDDDEVPVNDWLLTLYRALEHYGCDGVLGPVIPRYETPPSGWIIKGGFFERPRHETGAVLEWTRTRTGNALLKRKIIAGADGGAVFDPKFESGGEDRDFFRRMIEKGHVFRWCEEAAVYETVPAARFSRRYMIRRALLRGKMSLRDSSFNYFRDIGKSAIAVFIYTLSLPFLFFAGHHRFMKAVIRDFDHLGRLLGAFGVNVVREKYIFR